MEACSQTVSRAAGRGSRGKTCGEAQRAAHDKALGVSPITLSHCRAAGKAARTMAGRAARHLAGCTVRRTHVPWAGAQQVCG